MSAETLVFNKEIKKHDGDMYQARDNLIQKVKKPNKTWNLF